jgi:hypothetical protein
VDWSGDIQLYAFINLARDADERQLYFPTISAPRKELSAPKKEDASHSLASGKKKTCHPQQDRTTISWSASS